MSSPSSFCENAAAVAPVSHTWADLPSSNSNSNSHSQAGTRSVQILSRHDDPHPNSNLAISHDHISTSPPPALSRLPPNQGPGLSSSTPTPIRDTGNISQNIKSSRVPPLRQRSGGGPSLLTQNLAKARGILTSKDKATSTQPSRHENNHYSITSQKEESAEDASLNTPKSYALFDPVASKDIPQVDRAQFHASHQHNNGGSVTSHVSQAAIVSSATMAATTISVAGFSQEPFALYEGTNLHDLGVNHESVARSYRDLLLPSRGRGTSLERTDKERRLHEQIYEFPSSTYSHNPGDTALPRPPKSDDSYSSDDFSTNNNAEPRARYRSWRGEHLSLGPEKIWSIGNEESDEEQDGQVEKSITQALTGVEHNPRSRKASHSLRFFKEGLPEDPTKKRDIRLGSYPRERLPHRSEISEIMGSTQSAQPAVLPFSRLSGEAYPCIARANSFPLDQPTTGSIQSDYFGTTRKPRTPPESPPPLQCVSQTSEVCVTSLEKESSNYISTSATNVIQLPCEMELDGGEDSGEEKVSSALFVPHQAADDEVRDPAAPVSSYPPRVAPVKSRTQSQAGDYHPWLVRTDEPEPDEDQQEGAGQRPQFSMDNKRSSLYDRGDDIAVEDDHESIRSSQPRTSRRGSQVMEDHVHDHQLAIRQPLEAIALKPYRHQVGGHTTIWRFSRRAVCKKLNNRENEFYETVERWHRDLLPFLPR